MRSLDLGQFAVGALTPSPEDIRRLSIDDAINLDFAPPEPLRPGWHLFRFRARSEHRLKPRIGFDWGDGHLKHSLCPMGPSRSGAYEALIRLPREARGVRLKPTGQDIEFTFESFRHRTTSPPGAAAYLAGLGLGALLSWPVGQWLFAVKTRTLPNGDRLRDIHPFQAMWAVWSTGSESRYRREDYARWMATHDYDHVRDAARLRDELEGLAHKPLISVLMPVHDPPEEFLIRAIRSVTRQVYENWELCIVDDRSGAPHVGRILKEREAGDARIKIHFRSSNGRVSAATNTAFENLATGEWVVPLDHDDELRPNALAEVALAIGRSPESEFVYSDEDKIDESGNRFEPYFKPRFSIELLRCQNYLNHLTAIRARTVRTVGGWREGFEGSQDYDLYLRIAERIPPDAIVHIPKILYHWRAIAGSAAQPATRKAYAADAALRALREHAERSDLHYLVSRSAPRKTDAGSAVVEALRRFAMRSASPARHCSHPKPPTPEPPVTIIIPTRDCLEVLEPCVSSILDLTDYENHDMLIVDNNSSESRTHEFFRKISRKENVRVLEYDRAFNFSAINNFAVGHARGGIVALLNNDLKVISPDWLTHMVSWAALPEIGCVGAKLYYEDDTIQHAGIVTGVGGVAGHGHKGFPRNAAGYFGHLHAVRNVSAVTGACLVVRKSVYEEAGGLDEDNLGVSLNDVDFCLTVRRLGYRNVWTPHAELYHRESHSRGTEDTPEKQRRHKAERAFMKDKWGAELERDPFYSPNLSLKREDFSYR